MSVSILINGIDRTKDIDWESLKIQNVLTTQVDTCDFRLTLQNNISSAPRTGQGVIVYDTGVKVFGGIIVKTEERTDSDKMFKCIVKCTDYTRLLDARLVARSYSNMTVNAIVADIIDSYVNVGLTAPTIGTIDTYSETNQSSNRNLSNIVTAQGQSCYVTNASYLDRLKVMLKKTGSPTGYAYAKIYAHSGVYGTSSLPTGSVLATSDAFDVSTLGTSYSGKQTLTFSGSNRILLSAATNYVPVIEYLNGTVSDTLQVGADNTSPTHGGNAVAYNSGAWVASSSADLIFDIEGTLASAATLFTYTNVDCPIVIDRVSFNYITASACLQQLAQLVKYDWYVDYDKDIHFIDSNAETAPFNVNYNDGSYRRDSLVIRRDNSQVRNSIVVHGGDYWGTTLSVDILANGTDIIFPLPYRFQDFKASLTGDPLTVGTDYLDPADSVDALYNYNEKILKFKSGDTPTAGSIVRVSGRPQLPVIIKKKRSADVAATLSAEGTIGEREYLIVDKTLDSKETAIQRALAELDAYGSTISEGEFETETSGLKAGQKITITIPDRSLSEDFVINKVTSTMFTPTTMQYQVSLMTTKTAGIIDVLRALLLRDAKVLRINQDDQIDLLDGYDEVILIDETVTSSKAHNIQTEVLTISESATAQALNYAVEFVYGPFDTPSTTKREGAFDGAVFG